MKFREFFKQMRLEMGLSQEKFYKPIGSTRSEASLFETGKRGIPLYKVERLMEAYRLTISEEQD